MNPTPATIIAEFLSELAGYGDGSEEALNLINLLLDNGFKITSHNVGNWARGYD